MEAAETPSVEQRLSTVEGRLTALESGRAGTSSESSRVVLDVGGVCFKTTRTTLCSVPGSMLEAMFSGRHTVHQDVNGSYFIDRDGTHFRHVLNFLRDSDEYDPPALKGADLQDFKRELRYYGLEELVYPPPPPVPPIDEFQVTPTRFSETVDDDWIFRGACDTVGFSVNKAGVLIGGFTLLDRSHGGRAYLFKGATKLAEVQFSADVPECGRIMFSEPVEVVADERYHAVLHMNEGDDLRYGSRGQRRIEAGDDLVITYHDPDFTDTEFRAGLGDIEDNGTDVETGQIPSLLIYNRSAREVEERPRKRARA